MLFKSDKCDRAILSMPQQRITLHGKCMECTTKKKKNNNLELKVQNMSIV